MKGNYLRALAYTLREEEGHDQPVGGPYIRGKYAYSNDPNDPGGRTMMGIIEREYDKWRQENGLPIQDVRKISDDELNRIYMANYWLPARCDVLPLGIDLLVFDTAVNCGLQTGIRTLQRALRVAVDGKLGPISLKATNDADQSELIDRYSKLRLSYYKSLRTFAFFGDDWTERTERIRAAGHKMLTDGGTA